VTYACQIQPDFTVGESSNAQDFSMSNTHCTGTAADPSMSRARRNSDITNFEVSSFVWLFLKFRIIFRFFSSHRNCYEAHLERVMKEAQSAC
jgi:hypothetical protein